MRCSLRPAVLFRLATLVPVTTFTGFIPADHAQSCICFDLAGGCGMPSRFSNLRRFLLRTTGAMLLGFTSLMQPLLAVAQTAGGWDVVANFNSANNPAASNVFTYGSGISPTTFTPLLHDTPNCLGTPMDCLDNGSSPPTAAYVWWNGTAGNIAFAAPSFEPPTLLRMDPQDAGAIVRFTAPASAIYNISGFYEGIDQNLRPVYGKVYVNSTLAFITTLTTYAKPRPFQLTIPLAAGQTIDFNVSSASDYYNLSTGLAATIAPVVSGYVNPKYLIMGVTYAPPGGNSSSFVSYQNSTMVGNNSTITSSFSNGFSQSVAVGASGSVGSFFKGTVTGTQSTGWTQKSTTQNSVTMTKTNGVTFKTPGVPNVYSPVDHDYDIIWLWLNPVALFSVYSPDTIAWLGYGYDRADPLQEIDYWPIYVGYLNGDFGPLDAQDADALSRSWVTTQTFGPGYGPAITNADYPNILSADPFAYNPYDANSGCPTSCYTVTLASSNPPTTTDGRFTLSEPNNSTPQSLVYKQAPLGSTTGEQETYQLTNQTTTSATQTSDHSYTIGYGLEETFCEGVGGNGCSGGSASFAASLTQDLKQNWTMTWENISQTSVTNQSTQTDTAQITGPPCPAATTPCNPEYTEPHEFALYVDNLYGTFMFWPNPYFSISRVAPATNTVAGGSAISYTISTQANAGYDGTSISFNVTGLPAGATINQGSVAPGNPFTLTVSTTYATPGGTFPLTIVATSGSLSYSAYATLVVVPQANGGGSGTGTAATSLSATSVDFGNQTVGTSGSPTTITLSNSGSAPLTVTSITVTSGYYEADACGTVAAGSSCMIGVVFSPTTTGTDTGLLKISDNASGSPQSVPLTGVGMAVQTGGDFSIAASSLTVTKGLTGTLGIVSLTFLPVNGFAGTIALSSCTIPASFPGGSCSAPSTVVMNGKDPATVTVTIASSSTTARVVPSAQPSLARYSGGFALASVLMLWLPSRRRNWRLVAVVVAVLSVAVAASLEGCGVGSTVVSTGSNSSQPTTVPAGTYSFAITGTSGTLSHTTTIAVVVQ